MISPLRTLWIVWTVLSVALARVSGADLQRSHALVHPDRPLTLDAVAVEGLDGIGGGGPGHCGAGYNLHREVARGELQLP